MKKIPAIQLITGISERNKEAYGLVEKVLPKIEKLVKTANVVIKKKKGRIIFVGSGTAGALSTFNANRKMLKNSDRFFAVTPEGKRDTYIQGTNDARIKIDPQDLVIGIFIDEISPYTNSVLNFCSAKKIKTGCISTQKLLKNKTNHPIEIITSESVPKTYSKEIMIVQNVITILADSIFI